MGTLFNTKTRDFQQHPKYDEFGRENKTPQDTQLLVCTLILYPHLSCGENQQDPKETHQQTEVSKEIHQSKEVFKEIHQTEDRVQVGRPIKVLSYGRPCETSGLSEKPEWEVALDIRKLQTCGKHFLKSSFFARTQALFVDSINDKCSDQFINHLFALIASAWSPHSTLVFNNIPNMMNLDVKTRLPKTLQKLEDLKSKKEEELTDYEKKLKEKTKEMKAVESFIPKTYCLPDDLPSLTLDHPFLDSPVISKPPRKAKGMGIDIYPSGSQFLQHYDSLPSLNENKTMVVSTYVLNPLLYYGHKFTTRMNVLVLSVSPLVVVFIRQVFLFSHSPYSNDSFSSQFSHITNKAINKHHPDYVGSIVHHDMHYFADGFGDQVSEHQIDKMIADTFEIIVKTCFSLQYSLPEHVLKKLALGLKKGVNFFQLLGFDFLYDDQGNTWLMEVNVDPGMCPIPPSCAGQNINALYPIIFDPNMSIFHPRHHSSTPLSSENHNDIHDKVKDTEKNYTNVKNMIEFPWTVLIDESVDPPYLVLNDDLIARFKGAPPVCEQTEDTKNQLREYLTNNKDKEDTCNYDNNAPFEKQIQL
eukprot:CAMPEP_0174275214 /NCGR_PEP_ID=MMETSP0439-20130205/59705_1 /TAXON_ID=0 /ORGANISM="Stereomyxa ramosa, Strain Chinc5" /LENGTH=584 /DNA_ID=CAMNT_0015367299 /DNA_START=273 /DNA_END=2027 /DNA_ORIENTATION=-